MQKNYILLLLLLAGVVLFPTACNNGDDSVTPSAENLVKNYDYTVVHEWNDVFLEVERYAAGYRPGPAPRALGLIGLGCYEACVSGMPEFQSIANLYPGLTIPAIESGVNYHWPTVVNSIWASLMKRFFVAVPGDQFAKIGALEAQLEAQYADDVDATIFDKSKTHGRNVANAIWEWSKTDEYGHDKYPDPFAGYNWQDHFDGNGDWVPTYPGPGKPMYPFWGKARTFAISEADKLCAPPFPYSEETNSNYYAQGLEVYAQSGPTQSYEGKWIGEFWSDDLINVTFSPGPRWIAVANQVYELEKCDLETALFCNAKVGMATADAAVAAWYSKFYYNVERPVSFIQRVIDPNYVTPLNNPLTGDKGVTPSFPAFPSGHATMGAAGAEALSSVFGYDYSMTDRCHFGRADFIGTPRTFNSFYEMAEENAWSRVPLGVHFRMDADQGVNLGERCGRRVNNLPWKK
jgi:hypothetical protein